jgi:general stress protein YciG
MADDKDGEMTVREAGQKGGEKTAETHGREFYQEIGKKGGEATSESHGREFYQEIGKKGGEARADDEDVRSGELGRKGGEAVSQDREHMSEIGRKGGEHSHGGRNSDNDSDSNQRGGSHEQHVQAGKQSHKND